MRSWWRPLLIVLAVLLLALAGAAAWLVQGFDSERAKRVAADWMRLHHDRTLTIDGPLRLKLWPQPAVAVQRVRLSERGQPDRIFATIGEASLSLHLQPLLARREIEVESVAARGVSLNVVRDPAGAGNVDDLLDRVSGGAPQGGKPSTIDSVELADVELSIADGAAGVHGKLSIQQFSLGAFGPGLRSPLQLNARAALSEPRLNGALELQAALSLLPAPGAPPRVQLDKMALRLQGQGFELEALDARLQAAAVRLEYGAEQGLGDSRVEVEGAQLQFGGKRLGWQIDAGQLELKRLRLDVLQRRLQLDGLMLQLKGRGEGTTLDAQLRWPALDVRGEHLQGSAVEGALLLGGERRLRLNLRSQPPSGSFERITLPELHLDVDGQFGTSAIQGQADATLQIETQGRSATLESMTLQLRVDEPSLPALQLALHGQAQLTPVGGSGRVEGHVNDQRVDARVELQLDRARPLVDLQANLGTLDLDRFAAPATRGAAPAAAATRIDLQPLRALDARLHVNATRLLRRPYRVDALVLQARIDSGRLDLQRATGRAWGGRFEASGSADAAGNALALRMQAHDVDLRALLADTVGYDGLRGRGRIDADLRGRGSTVGAVRASLEGRATLALRPAAIRGVDLARTLRGWRSATQDRVASDAARETEFSQLDGSFSVRNGVAHNDDLDGRSDFLRVAGDGTIDLDQGRIDYRLRTRVVNTVGGRAGPEMVFLNNVTVPVELHGPFGHIEWQVNWASVTAAVTALSVPNAAVGTVTGVARGATGVVRGAAGVLRRVPGAIAQPPR